MIIFLFIVGILISTFLESLIFPIPLTLLVIIFLAVFQKKEWIFLLAIVAGIVLDSLTFRPLGVSSFFFLSTAGLIFLYGRKFETNHFLFVWLATLITSVVYESIFSPMHIVLGTFLVSLLCVIVFFITTFLQKRMQAE